MANPYDSNDKGNDDGVVGMITRQGDTLFLPMCLIAAFLTLVEWLWQLL